MPPLAPPVPPLSDGTVALRGFESTDVPAIVDAAGHDELLGSIALNPVVWEQRAADVGYWVAAHARGRGVATRAVRMLTDWAFGTLLLERLELRTQRDNHASQAVAAHAGFEPVASPVVRRPECEHLADVFFARVRGE